MNESGVLLQRLDSEYSFKKFWLYQLLENAMVILEGEKVAI